jgi:hypothetical protein
MVCKESESSVRCELVTMLCSLVLPNLFDTRFRSKSIAMEVCCSLKWRLEILLAFLTSKDVSLLPGICVVDVLGKYFIQQFERKVINAWELVLVIHHIPKFMWFVEPARVTLYTMSNTAEPQPHGPWRTTSYPTLSTAA